MMSKEYGVRCVVRAGRWCTIDSDEPLFCVVMVCVYCYGNELCRHTLIIPLHSQTPSSSS
ncbi:hypothetical protein EON63_24585 [archaeon]|nr:MAG: hypothetical protein EON63_24585 [archaeon]